jgi:hypothetical protein
MVTGVRIPMQKQENRDFSATAGPTFQPQDSGIGMSNRIMA